MMYPECRVLAVCGDGGFMMNSQEMETAVRLKLNLVVLILEDAGLRHDPLEQVVDSFLDFGLTFNPYFVKYAESYGEASRVESTGSLDRGAKRVQGWWCAPRRGADRLYRKYARCWWTSFAKSE